MWIIKQITNKITAEFTRNLKTLYSVIMWTLIRFSAPKFISLYSKELYKFKFIPKTKNPIRSTHVCCICFMKLVILIIFFKKKIIIGCTLVILVLKKLLYLSLSKVPLRQ